MKDFYPLVLRTEPPTVLTREEVDEYFEKRKTKILILHIPATNPQEERID